MDPKKDSDFTENITETLKTAFEKYASNADLGAMQDSAKEVADVAADFVRKYPIQCALGALAVGYLLGSATTKRKPL